jgi:hypothetical protein
MKHAYRIFDPATGLPTETPSYSGVPSAEAISEIAGPFGGVAAVATGSLPAKIALVTKASAVDLGHSALAGDRWPRPVDPIDECTRLGAQLSSMTNAMQSVYEISARALGREIPRQPEENKVDMPICEP